MRFNDKELGAWASVFSPDKEGLLEKKGAGRGQGYKQRWFRLKGSLLFYFKVDELGGWEVREKPTYPTSHCFTAQPQLLLLLYA
jgi:hypothetical protein